MQKNRLTQLGQRLGLSLLIMLLAACSSSPRTAQDGPPRRTVDVSRIPDAVPAPVVRTRAGNAPRYTVNGRTYQTLKDSRGYRKRGLASWYGTKFHGRPTANGERYDMFAMTAAHKTLPIPSYVRVTHVGNGRSIVVRINDRGPFHGDRIIDLSYAAARKLGIDTTGTGLVDVVDVTPTGALATPAPATAPVRPITGSTNGFSGGLNSSQALASYWYIQLGAFRQRDKAQALQSRVASVLEEMVAVVIGNDSLHRVVVGPIDSQQRIPQVQRSLEQSGLDAGFVTRRQQFVK